MEQRRKGRAGVSNTALLVLRMHNTAHPRPPPKSAASDLGPQLQSGGMVGVNPRVGFFGAESGSWWILFPLFLLKEFHDSRCINVYLLNSIPLLLCHCHRLSATLSVCSCCQ